jgi:hypothetical protein
MMAENASTRIVTPDQRNQPLTERVPLQISLNVTRSAATWGTQVIGGQFRRLRIGEVGTWLRRFDG